MESIDWKSKSILRSKENKQLKKTVKEITISRDSWKRKSVSHKKRADKLEKDLKKIKVKLNEIVFLKYN
jgi:hypothetical protein